METCVYCECGYDKGVREMEEDNRNGISAPTKEKMFQPFFTSNPNRARDLIGIEFELRHYQSTCRGK